MILLAQKDETRNVVVKERHCFIWEHQSFVVDEIGEGEQKVRVLKIDGIEKEFALKIPPFCVVEREVTAENKFSNEGLSRKY